MADIVHEKESSFVRCKNRRLQFGFWMWTSIVYCLFACVSAATLCSDVDIAVGTHPPNDIHIAYPGNPLEIYCTTDTQNYTSKDLEFSLGGRRLNSIIVNETTIKLHIEQPEIQRNFYYCTNKAIKKNCLNVVLVDRPPGNVTDFKCLSNNLDSLNCSWPVPKTVSDINYTLTFFVNHKSVKQCKTEREHNTWYCMWNTSSVPRYRQQQAEYVFNLVSCNVFGCNEQNITVDHFSVVKPDKPIDLTVLVTKPHSVILQWTIPNNIVDFLSCGIDHRIEYQIGKIDPPTEFRRVNASGLPPNNKTYRFELLSLPYAHMKYEVRVYIKSKLAVKDEFWSDFSFVVFHTATELPPRPPEIPAGAFMKSTYGNERIIYVYWKQLEEYEQSGANFTYKVLVTQDNRTKIHFPEKNKSMSFVVLSSPSMTAVQVSVKSWNILGSSENNSHLYIPPDMDMLAGPASFTKLAYENGTYELSWDPIGEIDNYTLFWCQYNWTQVCVGRMNYTILEPKAKNHIIDLPRDTKYQFAISANTIDRTSGMVWASCDISKDGEAMYAFPVKLTRGTPKKDYVPLNWTMECKLRDGIITGYNITYCPIIQTSNTCDDTIEYKSVYISNPKVFHTVIRDLLPSRTYKFDIALNTTYGLKSIRNATTYGTTLEDTPSSPTNISISNITYNSMIIAWDPPLHKNGNIKKYVIYNGNEYFDSDILESPNLTDVSRRYKLLTNLRGFSNYSWNIQACNNFCSVLKDTNSIYVRTSIGPPSKLDPPFVEHNPDVLRWNKPYIPAGSVDRYQLKRIKDNAEVEIYNVTDNIKSIKYCDGDHEIETYQVRAINFDEHANHGASADRSNVFLPLRDQSDNHVEYPGEWSLSSTIACRSNNTLAKTILLLCALLALGIGMVYASVKLYKKYRKMEDIKPVLPNGLGIPEKDNTKYTFSSWNPAGKDDKTSSDEMLLLPNKPIVSSPEIKLNEDNCGSSDHTDSTVVSDLSQGPVERGISTSDEGSDSSLQIDAKDDKSSQEPDETSSSDTESSRENSPYMKDKFQKNMNSGYVQNVISPGYVQTSAVPPKNAPDIEFSQPTTSSYVMAGLTPPVFTARVQPNSPSRPQMSSSGYVRPEDTQSKSFMNFPRLGVSPTNLESESLPSTPSLPPVAKQAPDSSYMQLNSLDAIPSLKQSFRSPIVKMPPSASGYISAGDAVMHKHLNILSGGQLADEPAILDPAMSPDAYCRFSWSTDPANDNLNTLLGPTSTLDSSKD